jgi:hypothetical protein
MSFMTVAINHYINSCFTILLTYKCPTSLRVHRLILQVLKLTTMKASSNFKITRTHDN